MKDDSTQEKAFEFKDPQGNNKTAFDSSKHNDGLSNNSERITFYIANTLTQPIFLKIAGVEKCKFVERQHTNMIEAKKYKTIQKYESKTDACSSAGTPIKKYVTDIKNPYVDVCQKIFIL